LEGRLGPVFGQQSWLTFEGIHPNTQFSSAEALFFCSLGFAIVWLMPNVHQMFLRYRPVCEDGDDLHPVTTPNHDTKPGTRPPAWLGKLHQRLHWYPSPRRAWVTGALFAVALMGLTRVSEFLYFQF
jgi:hypothetical protein